MKIAGKVAVVTGGASGIGQAIARALVAKGGKVAIFDLNETAGQALVQELGTAVIFEKVKVADEGSVAGAVGKTMSAFGAIHVCVNCAGIGSAHKTFGKDGVFPLEAWNRTGRRQPYRDFQHHAIMCRTNGKKCARRPLWWTRRGDQYGLCRRL